jgi:hypothetical protein
VSTPKQSSIPPARLEQYERLVATVPDLERKGASVPYTSVNGNMSSFLTEDGTLALRLSPADRDSFMNRFSTSLHEAHGTVMREYVTVPDTVLADIDEVAPWFSASYGYVASLKAKPTVRRKAAGS